MEKKPTVPGAASRAGDKPPAQRTGEKQVLGRAADRPAVARPAAEKPAAEKPGAHRHRFGDSDKTTVMPLSEILRQRGEGGEDDGQETKLTPPPGGAESDFGQVPTRLGNRNPNAAAANPKPATTGSVAAQPKTGFARAKPVDAPRDTSTQEVQSIAAPEQRAPVREKTPAPVQAKAPAEKPAQPQRTGEVKVAPARGDKKKPDVPSNQVIVFFSCKGGSGATAMSANVAHYYAQDQYKTCLVDMDLQLGDSLAALGLQARTTIAQSMEAIMRGEALTNQTLPKHASGVSVMSQVGSLDDLDKITSEGMASMVEHLRSSFDVVVVDGVRDFSDNVLAVLDVADRIAIVTVQEVLAIRRARWAFGILRKIGFDPKDITVVVNKFDAESEISFLTLKKIFEPGKVMAIPSEGRLVLQSLNRGVPLLEVNASHSLTRNIGRMAANLLGEASLDLSEATVIRKQQQPGLLSRIAFWRKS